MPDAIPAPAMTYLEGFKQAGNSFTQGVNLGQNAIAENQKDQEIAQQGEIARMQDSTQRAKLAADTWIAGEQMIMHDKEVNAQIEQSKLATLTAAQTQANGQAIGAQTALMEAQSRIKEATISSAAGMLEAQTRARSLDAAGPAAQQMMAIQADDTLSPETKNLKLSQIAAQNPAAMSVPGVNDVFSTQIDINRNASKVAQNGAENNAAVLKSYGEPVEMGPVSTDNLNATLAKLQKYDDAEPVGSAAGLFTALTKSVPTARATSLDLNTALQSKAISMDKAGNITLNQDTPLTQAIAKTMFTAYAQQEGGRLGQSMRMVQSGILVNSNLLKTVQSVPQSAMDQAASMSAAFSSSANSDLIDGWLKGDHSKGVELAAKLGIVWGGRPNSSDPDVIAGNLIRSQILTAIEVNANALHGRSGGVMTINDAKQIIPTANMSKEGFIAQVNALQQLHVGNLVNDVIGAAPADYQDTFHALNGTQAVYSMITGAGLNTQPVQSVQSASNATVNYTYGR